MIKNLTSVGSGVSSRPRVVAAVGILLVLFMAALRLGASEANTDLLKKLKNFDTVYLAALSAEAQVASPPALTGPGNYESNLQLRLSIDGPRRVAIEEAARPEIRYVAEDKNAAALRRSAVDYDDAGNMEVSVREKVVTLFDENVSAQTITDTFYSVTPAHEVKQTFQSTILSRCAPEASTLVLPLRRTLWSLGRGYADFLEEVTAVEQLADGLVKISATGIFDRGDPGRWELEVDPKASYLVRRAFFYAPNAKRPCVSMTNSDVRLNENCQYPGKATFVFNVAGLEQSHHFTFAEARLDARHAYFKMAKEMVDGPLPPNCIVNDYRTEPRTTLMTDDKGSVRGARHAPVVEPPLLTPEQRSRWYWVFFLNLGVFLTISGYFLVLRWRRERSQSSPIQA